MLWNTITICVCPNLKTNHPFVRNYSQNRLIEFIHNFFHMRNKFLCWFETQFPEFAFDVTKQEKICESQIRRIWQLWCLAEYILIKIIFVDFYHMRSWVFIIYTKFSISSRNGMISFNSSMIAFKSRPASNFWI